MTVTLPADTVLSDTVPGESGPPRSELLWTSRKIGESDYPTVLNWFREPDFYYRTVIPDTRPEWEIRELLDTDSRLLILNGEPAGLFAFESVGGEHGSHYQLQLRLRTGLPGTRWAEAYTAVVEAFRWRHEVVRLVLLVPEFDALGLAAARLLELTEEGTLTRIIAHRGSRYGHVFFSQIWTPDS